MHPKTLFPVLTLVLSLLIAPAAAPASAAAPRADSPAGEPLPAGPGRIFLPIVHQGLSATLQAAPAVVAPGESVHLNSRLAAVLRELYKTDVTFVVTDPAGHEVLRRFLHAHGAQSGAGDDVGIDVALDVWAMEGVYTVGLQVQTCGSTATLYDNDQAASFSVRQRPPTATVVPPTATPGPPTATAVPPTATPAPPTATAVPPTATFSLVLSSSASRANPAALQGGTVSGDIYVFVSPDTGAGQVRFYLDNTAASGTPFQTEANPPYDFAGGSASAANPYNTGQLANGQHTITASIDLAAGGTTTVTSSFTVANSAAATSTPRPTATSQPPAGGGAIYWGVNMSGVPGDMSKLTSWEQNVAGKAVSVVNWGIFWGSSSGGYKNWSNTSVNNVRTHGAIPLISWTPEGGDAGQWQLIDIINGNHDAYIRQFATDAKNWSHPFFLRIMHEMNGSWGYPWQEASNGNKRGEFVQAWKHIVDIFRQVGVTNASYVWCPNIDYPNSPNPSFASLYPGDGYVDWTCLDGYNWGTNRSSGWESFDKVYSYSYNEIMKFASSKPMMIGEFGSVEQGGSKANWFTDALSTQLPARYTKIRAAVYYNWPFDGVDWRIETTQAAQDAWRKGISSSYYLANQFGAIAGKVAVP